MKGAGALVFLVGAVILVAVFVSKGHGSSPAASPTPTVVVQADTASATTDQLTKRIEQLFKDKNLGSPTRIEITNYDGGGYGVNVEYRGLANVKLTKYQMATAYIGLHKMQGIKAMSLYDYVHVQDSGGNDSYAPYMKTVMQPEAIARVNWSADEADLTQDILPSVWSVTQDYSAQLH